ncbi:MAG TPA: LysM peptidoglycan-binding domain-containing protein [Treponemataceae bacterium]|nr:LysM peptidoglycan-binding domain-containing protein [Treponemataceae bacterium]
MKHSIAYKRYIVLFLLFICSLSMRALEYTVKKGDTLYSIGRRYKVSVDEILKANHMSSSNSIYAGQSLFIPIEIAKKNTYIVQKGDTLFGISVAQGTTVEELGNLNNLTKSSIYVGQELLLPTTKKTEPRVSVTKKEVVTDVVSLKKTKTDADLIYTVKKGDTLYSIALSNAVTVEEIRKKNNLTMSSVLKIGQKLSIESREKIQPATLKAVSDPRSYEKRKGDPSLIWPINAIEIAYVSGKISGVVVAGNSKDESVTAIREGVVMYSGNYRGYGEVVFLKSPKGYIYMYSGMSSLSVKKGQVVRYREEIGKIGVDVYTGKPVVNLMVYKNDNPVDPADAPRG